MSSNDLETDVDAELGLANEEMQKDVSSTAETESAVLSVDEEQGPTPKETKVKFARAQPHDITSKETDPDDAGDGGQTPVEGIPDCENNGEGVGKLATNSGEEQVKAARPHFKRRRQSSLHLRKQPSEYSISSEIHISSVVEESTAGTLKHSDSGSKKKTDFQMKGCFHRLFLNPSYSLRRQMLLTFGSVSSLTIILVMIVAIIASVSTGNAVKDKATVSVEEWVEEFASSTSKYVAQALSPKIMPNDMINIMVEAAKDRFSGYPTTDDDSLAPFFDTLSQKNDYPIKNKLLPLDWDFKHTPDGMGNVNNESFAEHVQDRWSKGYFVTNPRLSTVHATYTFRGTCDPRANPGDMTFVANCTDANNDIDTGGVFAPTPTNELVHRKASDLSPFMRGLFESQYDIKQLGYYFSNGGAGSSSFFPHYELNSANSYISNGCEWMKATNPIDPTLGPIATDEEIAQCHPEGTVVPTREYNPLERSWCRDQALEPNRNHNVGPFLSAWTKGLWQMVAGRAIYDRVTNTFIACIAIDFTMDIVENILADVEVDEIGTLTLVRNDANGSVVMSPNFDWDNAEKLTQLVNDEMLEAGVDKNIFQEIKSTDWYETDGSVFETEDFVLSVYPLPSAPEPYDPTYRPEFYAIFTVPKTAGLFLKASEISQEVDTRVSKLILFTVSLGLAGIIVVTLLILAAASWFVEPLVWMKNVGDQVVGKFGQEDESGIDFEREKTNNSCSLNTELSILAEEFSKMVKRFSGEGTAKSVHISQAEKLNTFDFDLNFAGLYQSRDKTNFIFNYPKTTNASNSTEDNPIRRCNLGRITQPPSSMSTSTVSTQSGERQVHKSSLFLWMVGLIATPMLVINL